MNENIKLCDILKGHEDETFYSPVLGNLTFIHIIYPLVRFRTTTDELYDILNNGKLYFGSDELCVFPSKDQRDWNKWVEEQKPKVPKTWEGYIASEYYKYDNVIGSLSTKDAPIYKHMLSLLKIYKLIEVGYGGNTDKTGEFYSVSCDIQNKKFIVHRYEGIIYDNFTVSFHTEEQAKEFISHPENVQLLEDYFMI